MYPDFGIGLLQSAFVGGYSVAIVISGHLVHRIPWRKLVASGLLIWIIATIGSGLSRNYDSYYLLLFSRMLSGVSEAAFHVVAPPMIQDRGGDRAGFWLSLYLTAIPVGLALGYVYGSLLAPMWEWAFFWESCAAGVVVLLLFFVRDNTNGGILTPSTKEESCDTKSYQSYQQSQDVVNTKNTGRMQRHVQVSGLFEEIKACLSSRILLCISFANSALVVVVSVLGTFGGAFILALELFEDERVAASIFGAFAALAGIIGTPLGGYLVDRIQQRSYAYHPTSCAVSGDDEDQSSSDLSALLSLLPAANTLICIASIFAWPTAFMTKPTPFLAFLFVGWLSLFASQSAITMSILLSVEPQHRSNAIAFSTLLSHILGDVPAPIFFGYLKDRLAPACNINSQGDFENLQMCRLEHNGIRITLAVAYSWMMVAVLFFESARRLCFSELERRQRLSSDCKD